LIGFLAFIVNDIVSLHRSIVENISTIEKTLDILQQEAEEGKIDKQIVKYLIELVDV